MVIVKDRNKINEKETVANIEFGIAELYYEIVFTKELGDVDRKYSIEELDSLDDYNKACHNRCIVLEPPVYRNQSRILGTAVQNDENLPDRTEYTYLELVALVGNNMKEFLEGKCLLGSLLKSLHQDFGMILSLDNITISNNNYKDVELTWDIEIDDSFYCVCGYNKVSNKYWITDVYEMDKSAKDEEAILWQQIDHKISYWEIVVICWSLFMLFEIRQEEIFKNEILY